MVERTKLVYCRLSARLVEIVERDGKQPICFLGLSGQGNVCDEPTDNFISLPFEPVFWRVYGLIIRTRRGALRRRPVSKQPTGDDV